mgnify:CR=1 FL=1
MTLFKPNENDKTSHIIHKIVECILFLDGKIIGDYVYSMINEEIVPSCLEACIITYHKLCEMISNILELEYTVTNTVGKYNVYMKINLLSHTKTEKQEITLKLNISNNIPIDNLKFEHELLVLESSGLKVMDFRNEPVTNLIKITKLIKNKQLKVLPIVSAFSPRDLFLKNVDLNKHIMKKKETEWVIVNPNKLKVLKYSLYTKLYNDYEDVCSVCMEGFDYDKTVFKTECNHLFHVSCWMRYTNVEGSGGCPNCRGSVWETHIQLNNNVIPLNIPTTSASTVINAPAMPAPQWENNIDVYMEDWNGFNNQVD